MKETIDDFFYGNENGLMFLPTPTGSGKTYSGLRAIRDYSIKYYDLGNRQLTEEEKNRNEKPIIFLCDLKHLLPERELREAFAEKGKEELFDKLFLKLNSYFEGVLEALNQRQEYWENINNTIWKRYNITSGNELIKSAYYILKLREEIKVHTYPEKEELLKIKEQKFRQDIEPLFRKAIKKYIIKKNFVQKEDYQKALKTKEYKWLVELYPNTLLNEKKIIMMSVDKFCNLNSNLYENPFYYYNSDKISDSIIVIDEVDKSYEVILNKILKDNIKNQIDLIKLYNKIRDKLANHKFIDEFLEKHNSEYKNNNEDDTIDDNYHTTQSDIINEETTKEKEEKIRQDLKTLTEIGNRIYNEYALEHNIKNEKSRDGDSENILYESTDYITVNKNNDIKLLLEINKEEKINKIIAKTKKEIKDNPGKYKDCKSVDSLLYELKSFISFFYKKVVPEMAKCYKYNTSNKKDPLNFENSIFTVLNEFELDDDEIRFISKNIFNQNISRQKKEHQKNKKLTTRYNPSFCLMGFKLHTFMDSLNHDSKSKIFVYNIPYCPEIIIEQLANNAKVIGMSATCNIDTVINNYDLEYLKSRINVIELTKKQENRIKTVFENSTKNYKNPDGTDNIKINVDIIKRPECDDWNLLDTSNRDEFSEVFYSILRRYNLHKTTSSYYQNIYYRLFYFFQSFIKHKDTQSAIAFLNSHPNKTGNINSDILMYMFNYIVEIENANFDVNKNIIIIKSKNYVDEIEKFKNIMKKGEKAVIITTYNTLGAGYNLNHESTKEIMNKTIKSNNFPKRITKDIDEIFLERPTHILPILEVDDKTDYDDKILLAFKYIIIAERLRDNNELSNFDTKESIKKALKFLQNIYKINNSDEKIETELYNLDSTKKAVTKIIIQALGRICRTNNKSHNIYIYASDELKNSLAKLPKNNLYIPEFQALAKKIEGENKNQIDDLDQNQKFQLEVEQKSKKSTTAINKMKNKIFNTSYNEEAKLKIINRWKKLRSFALTYPTISKQQLQKIGDSEYRYYYSSIPDQKTEYYYKTNDDFLNTTVSINPQTQYVKVSAKHSRLEKIMQIPTIRQYFIEKGFATEFAQNDNQQIMTPIFYNNIYKGALGEEAGKCIFENFLSVNHNNITLADIETKYYEYFDYKIKDTKIYVDFKNWSDNTKTKDNTNDAIEHIKEKALTCQSDCVFIANIFSSDFKDSNGNQAPIKQIKTIKFFDNNRKKHIFIYCIPALIVEEENTIKIAYNTLQKIEELIQSHLVTN